MKQKPNIKYIETFIRTELERRARSFVTSIQEEGYDKDCGQHARRLLSAAILDEIVKCNVAIDKAAERLGFDEARHAIIDFHEYWINQFHSPEYWEAEDRLTKIRGAIVDISARLSLRVAMGMTAEELEKELDAVDFYEISRK